MHRRGLLALLASAPVAGCAVGYRGQSSTDTEQADIVSLGTPPDVCAEPVDPGGIQPIVDPAFGRDWAGHPVPDRYDTLTDDTVVIGVTAGERARAYPISVLWYHEAVNDHFGGPLLVTYCSLCRSGLVARRVVDGAPATFATSGLLWDPPREYAYGAAASNTTVGATRTDPDADIRVAGNVVLYDDRTRSYWSQIIGQAICGPLAGTEFDIVPSTVARWGVWREQHPETEVLLPPPTSTLG
ncbi:DUF3179 domain-containing (seleno)protein [Halosegnis sp.]|uniref:DUF3179 domain-containing (seleno)protein n=1 Tax=Halosegnis sp. TaxID=2864959 RepID=UPI0035D49FC9